MFSNFISMINLSIFRELLLFGVWTGIGDLVGMSQMLRKILGFFSFK